MAIRDPELLRRWQAARSIGVITGAGVSAESGIQTYRGEGGVYDDPVDGEATVEALTAEVLRDDPERTWRALLKVARQSAAATPNAAHRALTDLEEAASRFVLITQNVDGLHQAAGTRQVIDVHGTAADLYCMTCGQPDVLGDPTAISGAPTCRKCGGVLRPDVVLFGEALPRDKVARMMMELRVNKPDVILVVGTTAVFPYIADPVLQASAEGRLTIEVNPQATALTPLVDCSLREAAGSVLPRLVAQYREAL